MKDEVDNNANVAEQAIANWKELYLKEKALHDKIKVFCLWRLTYICSFEQFSYFTKRYPELHAYLMVPMSTFYWTESSSIQFKGS